MLKAPFPYFGGKASIASVVWRALGQPKHYIEPFFGSGAVLLNRTKYLPGVHVETVNDADGLLSNVWRSLQFAPDEVARFCDWPVNHCDLSARKRELIKNQDRVKENLITDPKWCDPVLAGYWIYAASCWIGSGLTREGQIPHLTDGGKGVHALGQIPHLTDGGKGVHALGKRPHVTDGGKGVHALGQRPHVSHGGKGVQEPYNTNIFVWLRQLSERLRYVRVVCGDWTQVCGGNWQDKMGDVGIFFDPPYADPDRDPDIYNEESMTVARDVEAWCLERGRIPSYRIVCAGYDSEYQSLIAAGWTVHRWRAKGGYANTSGKAGSRGKANRHREILVFSPHCERHDQRELFP